MEYLTDATFDSFWGVGVVFPKKILVVHSGNIGDEGTITIIPLLTTLSRYKLHQEKNKKIQELLQEGYVKNHQFTPQINSPLLLYRKFLEQCLQRQEEGYHRFTVEVIKNNVETIVRAFMCDSL